MKHIIWPIVAVIGLSVAPHAAADPYTSDELTFVHDMQAIGVASDASAIVDDGWRVCGLLASGIDPTDIAAHIFYNSTKNFGEGGLTIQMAQSEVGLAYHDLCPQVSVA